MTTRDAGKLVSPDAYLASYGPDRGFEAVCTLARQRRNLAFLQTHRPLRILEVGCGGVLLSALPEVAALSYLRWTVVEPVAAYADLARSAAALDPRLTVIDGYIEVCVAAAREAAPDGYDAVILSSVLHETTNPDSLLSAAVSLLVPGGRLIANVPNALSFHRLLACAMELIDRPDALSQRDVSLGHPQVFDRNSFADLLRRNGLKGLEFDGYLFKPFTNDQLETLVATTSAKLVEGLIRLGRDFPDNAAEICFEATLY